VVPLSAFVTLCEGYLGVLPTIKLWGKFFYSKLGTVVKSVAAQCSTVVAVRRPAAENPFPPITVI